MTKFRDARDRSDFIDGGEGVKETEVGRVEEVKTTLCAEVLVYIDKQFANRESKDGDQEFLSTGQERREVDAIHELQVKGIEVGRVEEMKTTLCAEVLDYIDKQLADREFKDGDNTFLSAGQERREVDSIQELKVSEPEKCTAKGADEVKQDDNLIFQEDYKQQNDLNAGRIEPPAEVIRVLQDWANRSREVTFEQVDVTEWHDKGRNLAGAAPDIRGFELGKQIFQRDAIDRPICFEGWVEAKRARDASPALKDQVCGAFRPDVVYMHLQSRGFNGKAFAYNAAPGTQELNNKSGCVEKDGMALSRLKEVYFRQVFEYEGESREVMATNVQIWLRNSDGKPELLAGRYTADNGSRVYDYGPADVQARGEIAEIAVISEQSRTELGEIAEIAVISEQSRTELGEIARQAEIARLAEIAEQSRPEIAETARQAELAEIARAEQGRAEITEIVRSEQVEAAIARQAEIAEQSRAESSEIARQAELARSEVAEIARADQGRAEIVQSEKAKAEIAREVELAEVEIARVRRTNGKDG